ncbi:MAG: hypothetical protein QOJ03_2670, partial [Frankiaceae bacterium]|nr:hypothetical protein [Frankiaceae bacterium]
LLDPGRVADEVVAMIGTNRILRSIPRRRALGARLTGLAPTTMLPLIGLTAKAGERNRRKSLRE